ncbi:hypothetical protein OAP30_01445 [Nitrosopumilus sp.]|nr:hypothetical protein [Nitrosopumilus sp.]
MKEKMESSKKISPKKVPRSLNNLLKVEQDLKKMNLALKKVVKKVKTLEKENSELQKKLNKR